MLPGVGPPPSGVPNGGSNAALNGAAGGANSGLNGARGGAAAASSGQRGAPANVMDGVGTRVVRGPDTHLNFVSFNS